MNPASAPEGAKRLLEPALDVIENRVRLRNRMDRRETSRFDEQV